MHIVNNYFTNIVKFTRKSHFSSEGYGRACFVKYNKSVVDSKYSTAYSLSLHVLFSMQYRTVFCIYVLFEYSIEQYIACVTEMCQWLYVVNTYDQWCCSFMICPGNLISYLLIIPSSLKFCGQNTSFGKHST